MGLGAALLALLVTRVLRDQILDNPVPLAPQVPQEQLDRDSLGLQDQLALSGWQDLSVNPVNLESTVCQALVAIMEIRVQPAHPARGVVRLVLLGLLGKLDPTEGKLEYKVNVETLVPPELLECLAGSDNLDPQANQVQ